MLCEEGQKEVNCDGFLFHWPALFSLGHAIITLAPEINLELNVLIVPLRAMYRKQPIGVLVAGGFVGLILLLSFTRPSLIIEHYWQGSDRIHCACWFLYVSTIL
jgi:hypothetical protein